ncbi:hypothetical protein [uncultured Flavobacterium sp.]|uniref:hypothetical protein n=1 Tax=uncultured Flavobacterium sp. TaxID=165435 RepID=UPI0030ED2BCF
MKDKKIVYLTIALLLVCFISVWLFTRKAFSTNLDLTQTGQIGDTIGGITAPLINILGAILVYLSFKEQFKANQIQAKALNNEIKQNRLKSNAEILHNLYNECKEDFFMIEYNGLKGTEALKQMVLNGDLLSTDEYLDNYLAILYRIVAINDKLHYDELDIRDKTYISNMLNLFYLSKIKKNFEVICIVALKEKRPVYAHLKEVKENFDKYFTDY